MLGGVGIELVAVGTLLLAAGMRAASCGEYDPRPCIGWEPVVLTLLAGTGLAATGAGMIYYGALDAPPQPRQPTAALPWTPRPPRGLSLTFRF